MSLPGLNARLLGYIHQSNLLDVVGYICYGVTVVFVSQPLPKGWDMAEDHGAPEAGQLFMV